MEKFFIGEMYRLELHWTKVKYEKDGVCELEGAYFSGPALQIANKINNNDSIKIDFHSQYLIFTTNVYIGKLSWGEVVYNKDNVVGLKNARLTHDTELNKVPKLKDGDYLAIDTENHEEAVHRFNLVYVSYVVDENGVLYKF
jgi:hypothetical protein